jgi:hypothetical protein
MNCPQIARLVLTLGMLWMILKTEMGMGWHIFTEDAKNIVPQGEYAVYPNKNRLSARRRVFQTEMG